MKDTMDMIYRLVTRYFRCDYDTDKLTITIPFVGYTVIIKVVSE